MANSSTGRKSTTGTRSKSNTSGRTSRSGKSGSKRTGQTKRSSGRKKNTGTLTDKQKELILEIEIIAVIVVSLVAFLGNFGLCGSVGNAISYFLFGVFGIVAYVVPVFFLITAAFIIANLDNKILVNKVIISYILLIFICSLLHLILMDVGTFSIGTFYKECAVEKTGGGFIGALVSESLSAAFATVGAYIIEIAVFVVCIVLLTERSVMRGLQRGGSKVYKTARDGASRVHESNEYAREESRRRREESDDSQEEAETGKRRRKRKKIKGVAFNTKLEDEESYDLDIHEITDDLVVPEVFKGHIDLEEGDNGQYFIDTDEEDSAFAPMDFSDVDKALNGSAGNYVQVEEKVDEPSYDEDGFFKPKEQIHVSKEAKEVMARKPFSTGAVTPAGEAGGAGVEGDKSPKAVTRATSNTQAENDAVAKEINNRKVVRNYTKPPHNILAKPAPSKNGSSKAELTETAKKLELILQQFGVPARVTHVSRGPSVTRYEIQPEMGIKVSKITALSDDIKLNLAASDIRIEAPIPGKAAVGIEVPNGGRDTVCLRELIESKELAEHPSKLAFAAGKDIAGKVIVADIAKMPHMLVAGTTGSGKSVFTNSIIMSILYRATPEEVRLIIIDPKVVEFGMYNGIPHLLMPVVTEPKKAAGALTWAVAEMTKRYKLFADHNVKDLKSYNEKVVNEHILDSDGNELKKEPQILIVIDELADLMMAAAKEVEDAICRLAQLARAAGIHLIIATQRPSVDVVTGLIKANIPSRVALLVSSGTDSRTIIDMNGAEKLLGNGDMLFYPSGYIKPVRVQGAYVSDTEIQTTIKYLLTNNESATYDPDIEKAVENRSAGAVAGADDEKDEYFVEAARLVIEKEKASTSMLQRVFRIGFNRAARLMDQLSDAGVVGAEEGTKPRKVIMTKEQFENYLENGE